MRDTFKVTNDKDPDGTPTGGSVEGTGLWISWQDGPLGQGSARQKPNGAFVETVLAACLARLEFYQASPFRCTENQQAIGGIFLALNALEARTNRRVIQGIEGTNAPDAGNPPLEPPQTTIDFPEPKEPPPPVTPTKVVPPSPPPPSKPLQGEPLPFQASLDKERVGQEQEEKDTAQEARTRHETFSSEFSPSDANPPHEMPTPSLAFPSPPPTPLSTPSQEKPPSEVDQQQLPRDAPLHEEEAKALEKRNQQQSSTKKEKKAMATNPTQPGAPTQPKPQPPTQPTTPAQPANPNPAPATTGIGSSKDSQNAPAAPAPGKAPAGPDPDTNKEGAPTGDPDPAAHGGAPKPQQPPPVPPAADKNRATPDNSSNIQEKGA